MHTFTSNLRWVFIIYCFTQNYTASAQSFCTKYFDMKNSVLVEGSDKQIGAVYKFSEAAPNIDVYIKIENIVNAYIAVFDRTDLGYGYAWQPHIPTLSADGGYIDWLIYFKVAGTNKDTTACPSFTAIDIDGAGSGTGVQEYVQAVGYDSNNVMTPTELTISNPGGGYTLQAKGPESGYDGISTTQQSVMIQFNYNNVTNFKYRTGATGHAVESSGRYFSLHFNAYLTCNNVTNAGQIGSNETMCTAFDPQIITNTTLPSGGAGTLEYQWLKNTVSSDPLDTNWDVIPNTNSDSYDPPSLSVTTHFMRQIRCFGCAQWMVSNVVSKTIPVSPAINISANATKICPNGSVSFSSIISPAGGYGYQWQRSLDSVTWTNVSSATASTKTVNSITGVVYFRLKVVTNGCAFYSAGTKITAFDDTPPVLSGVPNNTTAACNAIPAVENPTATDNCQLQDIVFHETYSSCTNALLNQNGSMENIAGVTVDTVFQGYPAKKLPNYSAVLTGWEMGFPNGATNPGLLVHDNNNSINNPDGSYFMWLPGNSFCAFNGALTLQGGQCVEISMWAAAFSSTNPQQSSRILVEAVRTSDNAKFEPYSQVLPASASATNMNWQKIVTKFVTPATGTYKFYFTQQVDPVFGPTPKGMAIDGVQIKNCCETPPTDCKNYTITRTWTARDQTGNVTKQSQVITVQDTQAPTFNNVPANTTVCGTVPAAPSVTATDNCDATPSVILLSEVSTKTNNSTCTDNFYTVTRTWKAVDNCGNQVTATQVITVLAPPMPTIAGTPICSGGTTTLTATLGTCFPTVTYQWQHWNGVTWDNVGTNSATFNTPVLTSNQDYRVTATINSSTCLGTSATYTVEVVQGLSISTPLAGFTECLGGTKKLEISTQGGRNTTYQWQISSNNTNFTNIVGETAVFYTPSSTAVGTKYYRVVISSESSGCGSIESESATVIVVTDPIVNVSVSVSEICEGGRATLTANINDHSNSCGLQWISKTNTTDWAPIVGETSTTLTTSALNNTTRYRVTLNCSGNGCCN